MLYHTKQEIEERKVIVEAKQAARKSSDEVRRMLLKQLKPNRFTRFCDWFNNKFGWFFKNGMK
jgi:hypothetical protein